MKDKCMELLILMQMKMLGLVEDFRKQERGSQVVEMVILIAIIIAVAIIFRDEIVDAVENIMDDFRDFFENTTTEGTYQAPENGI